MSTYLYALNKNNEFLFSNFPDNFHYLIDNFKEGNDVVLVKINGEQQKARIGRKSNSFGTIYTFTTELKYINRVKLFRELVSNSVNYLEPMIKLHRSILDEEIRKTEQLIHNLTSLNTYSIQALFSLIPQKTLSENINKQKDKIKEIITAKPYVTVESLLKLIKYNLAMKVEFSVFESSQKPNYTPMKISHSIRNIILSALQIFIEDFENKKIEVSLDAGTVSERRLYVDDDSLFVSFFYLFENCLKYCCRDSKFKIFFNEESDCFSVTFDMISIRIDNYEIAKLTDYGYRSSMAKQLNSEGKGIGMFRVVKTLKLNNAELEIIPRYKEFHKERDGVHYERNLFKIKFMSQPNFFS